MINLFQQLFLILPEIILATMAMVILILDLFLKDKRRYFIYVLSQLTLLVIGILIVMNRPTTPQFAFSHMFVSDSLAFYLKLMSCISLSVVFLYSRSYLISKNLLTGEYFSLSLFALLGMLLMISSNNLLLMYMGLELLSLSLYTLVALNRDDPNATEAAMKYFVLGALASGLLLYGMSMLYGLSGSLDIMTIASTISQNTLDPSILTFGLVFVVVGIAFKLGAVPFQMWVPDIYQGATTPITMMISSVPKFAAVAMLIRFLFQGLDSLAPDWEQMLLIMAILSMAIGNITAIAQTNIKRMLAYSTISHVGFILLGCVSGSVSGVSSVLFYVTCYVLMTLAAFGIIVALSTNNKNIELIEDLKGLSKRQPWVAALMMITILSLAGIPPTVGFYAKFSVLQAVVSGGMVWPAVVAVLMTMIGMFYYLRIIKLMYFDEPKITSSFIVAPGFLWALTINTGGILVLGIMPQTLMNVAALSATMSL